jgi:hypothetical protein
MDDDLYESVWMSVDTDAKVVSDALDAIRKHPMDPGAYFRLVRVYSRSGRDAEALDVALTLMRRRPSRQSLLALIGIALRHPSVVVSRVRHC